LAEFDILSFDEILIIFYRHFNYTHIWKYLISLRLEIAQAAMRVVPVFYFFEDAKIRNSNSG